LNGHGTPVRLACCPVTLNPLQPDINIVAREFNAYTETLMYTLTARSFGPILFGSDEIMETHRQWVHGSHVVRNETHWLGVSDHSIRLYLRNIRALDNRHSERLDFADMLFPLAPEPEREHHRTVRYIQGDYSAEEHYIDTFQGFFSVENNGGLYRCLKMSTRRLDHPGRHIDTFIDTESGHAIYVEIFNHHILTAVQQIIHHTSGNLSS
jgi:hypothetical protein